MVVSIDISGVLESKLRRLVELGIYASVSEAVRDAIRKMLSNMDLVKIATNIYLNIGSSLHYACEFAETTCNKFIDYLLLNGVSPGLGWQQELPCVETDANYILDLSSLYVIFNTLLVRVFDLIENYDRLRIYIPDIILNEYRLAGAIAFRNGISNIPQFELIRIEEEKSDTKLKLTDKELKIINFIIKRDFILVTDDFYIQNILKKENIKTVPSISFLKHAYKNNIIKEIEYKEILFSLRGLPYVYPPELEQG